MAVGLQAGEEAEIKQQLQALAARQSSAERCSLVRGAIQGDASGGGLTDALRDVVSHSLSLHLLDNSPLHGFSCWGIGVLGGLTEALFCDVVSQAVSNLIPGHPCLLAFQWTITSEGCWAGFMEPLL